MRGVLYARYDLADHQENVFFRPTGRAPRRLCGATTLSFRAANPVSLGEGFTPMIRSREYPNVYIKDEGLNPTGSFKARGLSAAVTMARHFGLKKLAIPSAGNAAGALAAYAAAAGLEAHIFMPKDVPMANRVECDYYGAHVTLVDGLISDCARKVAELKDSDSGKRRLVRRLHHQRAVSRRRQKDHGIRSRRATRLAACRKASSIPPAAASACSACGRPSTKWKPWAGLVAERPKMIAVQSAGCAPIVKAWDEGKPSAEMWPNASTLAAGLRVPKPYGDYLILDILKKSKGTAVSATDEEIFEATRHWAKLEGIFAAPEGAACLVAYRKLLANGFFQPQDTVVLFNTGTGLKYLDVLDSSVARSPSRAKAVKPATRQIAGIIGPY